MSKKQRIKELEKRISELEVRVVLLEARPAFTWYPQYTEVPQKSPDWWQPTYYPTISNSN